MTTIILEKGDLLTKKAIVRDDGKFQLVQENASGTYTVSSMTLTAAGIRKLGEVIGGML